MKLTLNKPGEQKGERRNSLRLKRNVSLEAGKIEYPLTNLQTAPGRTVNISRNGVRFTTDKEYEPDTLLQISVTLPGWTRHHPGFIRVYENSLGRPFTAVGKVTRCEHTSLGYDVAARFVNVDPDDAVGLEGYLDKQLDSVSDN